MSYKNLIYGKNRVRRDYARVQTNIELPSLIEVQTKSFAWFINEGLKSLLEEISPITAQNEKLELRFGEYEFDEAKYSVQEAKRNDVNYSKPLKVDVDLLNKETGEIKSQKIFLGDFPMMTPWETFIINGAERVIVTQIIRSAGVFFSSTVDKKSGRLHYYGQVIPTRGAWIEFEMGSKDIWYAKLDRSKKIPLTTFLRAMGLNSNREITNLFGNSQFLMNTFEKDDTFGTDDALEELYDKLRPGEKATPEGARSYLASRLFETRRYDLASVGRYKVNKKLDLLERLAVIGYDRCSLDQDIIEVNESGQNVVVYSKGTSISKEVYEYLKIHRESYRKEYEYDQMLVGNSVVLETLDIELMVDHKSEKIRLIGNDQTQTSNHITLSDILAAVGYYLNLHVGKQLIGKTDDIDHLGNRRLRLIGELLQNQFRIGLTKLEKNVRDRMSTSSDTRNVIPEKLINIRTLNSSIREFFGSSQLSQFMDQINPLSELTNKRRLSALGAGGLTRDRAGFEVRDVHVSHYGRICPIETPEGQNIGLISSLSTYAKVDQFGFIQTPYLTVIQVNGEAIVTNKLDYYTADSEEAYYIAQANVNMESVIVPAKKVLEMEETISGAKDYVNEPKVIKRKFTIIDDKEIYLFERTNEKDKLEYYYIAIANDPRTGSDLVIARHQGDNEEVSKNKIDLMDVSPKQIVSVSAACIPFLEHDDANRALMGANMQRQAIPLLIPEAAFVGTGIEAKAARDSGVAIIAEKSGIVQYVDALKIIIKNDSGELSEYTLLKYERSNHSTCVNHKPIVKVGEHIEAGSVLADGGSMDQGEMALGRNVVIAFMTWHGYNFEDAVIMSERLVIDDVFTSIHIEKYEVQVRDTKLGKEEITRELDNEKKDSIANLDSDGIIRVGAEVKEGDVLVGKVTPKGQTEETPEERLSNALFADYSKDVRNTSLRVPHGGGGIVHRIDHFKRKEGAELLPGVNEVVRVFIVQKRKITEGDKMSGRHGNKGVISKILPQEDMPYMEDGTPIDIMLNPQGIPSRLNIGQVLEIHLGMAAKKLGVHISTPVFDGVEMDDLKAILKEAGMAPDGKTVLYDGETGKPYDNRISVGVMYMIKLAHMVDDKLHARSEGPYTLVTQQPMGGKAQNGGQRFGEMEVWALEAYGAAYTLREMLTIKSDDMVGRNKVYKAIVDGQPIPDPGIPESFRVLVKELQALCLDVELIDSETKENVANKSLVQEIAQSAKAKKLR